MSSKTIADIYSHTKRAGHVGLEIEVEFKPGHLPFLDVDGPWRAIEDHSLRNGIEYVTRQPLQVGSNLLEKIKALTDKLDPSKLSMSNRTSVHVHRNVQDLTPVQVWTVLLAYWILEAPLLHFCGEARKGNLFCLSLADAPGILQHCYKDLQQNVPFSTFTREFCKYGGQNLAVISQLGSIEYRGMRGTTDPELIALWATTLYEIGERAKQFADPAELMDFYLDSEKDQFLMRLCPVEFIDKIKASGDYVGLIKKHVYDLADLAYFHDDWKKYNDEAQNYAPPKKKGLLNSLLAADEAFAVSTAEIYYD